MTETTTTPLTTDDKPVVTKSNTKKIKRKLQQPGKLISKVQLTLNTYDAQRLFLGWHQDDGVSLVQFGRKMATIWDAAAGDDPFADWLLLRVYDGIKKCRNQLTALTNTYEQQLAEANMQANLTLEPFASGKPLVKDLWFRTPYGYLAAGLIADFDKLMRVALTAFRIGVLFNRSHEQLREEWYKKIALIIKLPLRWQATGLTRSTIDKNPDALQSAIVAMGKIPEAILTGKLRPPFSPYLSEQQQPKEKTTTKEVKAEAV